MNFLILNGPNINILGVREPDVYGSSSYMDLIHHVSTYCKEKGILCDFYQSNHEGDLVDKIQEAYGRADGIIINPAAYTHTSVAIMDALKSVAIPAVEVHLTDLTKREEFRKLSYPALACIATVQGYGFDSYTKGIDILLEHLGKK